MEAHRRVEFAGGAELATRVEKTMTGLMEKAAAGGRRGGDVGRRSRGTMEREAR
jgi:hypothetical protein